MKSKECIEKELNRLKRCVDKLEKLIVYYEKNDKEELWAYIEMKKEYEYDIKRLKWVLSND